MAWTDRYVTVSGAGSGDGSSWENAWTLAQAVAGMTGGYRCYVEHGTYTITSNTDLTGGTGTNPSAWIGVASDHSSLLDVGRSSITGELVTTSFPVIDAGTSYLANLGSSAIAACLRFTGSGTSRFMYSRASATYYRCACNSTHATNGGATVEAYHSPCNFIDCDFTSATSAAHIIIPAYGCVIGCRVWNTNATPSSTSCGIHVYAGYSVLSSIIYGVGQALRTNNGVSIVKGCTLYGCGVGIKLSDSASHLYAVQNIIYSMASYGISGNTGALLESNAIGNCTSGRLDLSASIGQSLTEIDGIALTGDPFVDAANKDFRLNNTAGAGAACRAAGLGWLQYLDLGAVQHQDSGGGGIPGNLSGGLQ